MSQYEQALSALEGVSADFRLGMAVTSAGSRVVRVNIPSDAPKSVVDAVHERLRSIPHEIRRVQPAQLEARPR